MQEACYIVTTFENLSCCVQLILARPIVRGHTGRDTVTTHGAFHSFPHSPTLCGWLLHVSTCICGRLSVGFGQDVQAKGAAEGKDGGGKKKEKTPGTGEPPAPTPTKREDVIFDVTDKNIQKVM